MGAMGRRDGTQRGLTMVELLVTIVLSGLFFAAMVPVFVMASQQGQTDRARVLGTNAAQSAIEILRDLPYDDLYDTNWESPGAVASIVDPQWKGSGSDTEITVEPYPADADKGRERYLNLSVTTRWTEWKGRVREVTLRTAVYRQGLGTHTLVLYAYPLDSGYIRQIPVNIVARMDAADAYATRRIDFEVWANNGTVVDQWSVYTDQSDIERDTAPWAEQHGDGYWYYTKPWTAPNLLDGTYTFIATARPIDPTPADPNDPLPPSDWARKVYILDQNVPAKPVVSECKPGFQPSSSGGPLVPQVSLVWTDSENTSDVGHVEILRSGVAADGSLLATKTIVLPFKWATHYVDRDVDVGDTYLYKLMVEDAQGQRGEWSDGTSCIVPSPGAELAVVLPVGSLVTSVAAPSVKLTWTKPTPSTGIDYYRVYRDTALSVPIATVSASLPAEYTDTFSEYGSTYTYLVTAVDDLGSILVESVALAAAPVMVPEPPKVGMRVTVSAASPLPPGSPVPAYARVVIQSLDTGYFYPQNTVDYPKLRLGKKADVWNTGDVFYPGRYQVIAMFYTNTGRCGTYNFPLQLDASATPVNVVYMGPN